MPRPTTVSTPSATSSPALPSVRRDAPRCTSSTRSTCSRRAPRTPCSRRSRNRHRTSCSCSPPPSRTRSCPTIRSRTQHFRFELLPAEDLERHVRWVAEDAGLAVDDAMVDYVLRVGGGSARDTLSALDQVVAAGSVPGGDDVIAVGPRSGRWRRQRRGHRSDQPCVDRRTRSPASSVRPCSVTCAMPFCRRWGHPRHTCPTPRPLVPPRSQRRWARRPSPVPSRWWGRV